jgi:Na+/phosphate symporter
MEYVATTLGALILIAWICAVLALLFYWFETGDLACALLGIILLATGLGLMVAAMVELEAKNPCATYEVQSRYNPAIKTYAPMRVCVERGEWVVE